MITVNNTLRLRIPDSVVATLPRLYPDHIDELAHLTDLSSPVFYGPRFRNVNSPERAYGR